MEQPFYVGQEVCVNEHIKNPYFHLRKGDIKTITMAHQCSCGEWYFGIGLEKPGVATCRAGCGKELPIGWLVPCKFLSPISNARIRYVEKQVEIAPQVKELEKCLN